MLTQGILRNSESDVNVSSKNMMVRCPSAHIASHTRGGRESRLKENGSWCKGNRVHWEVVKVWSHSQRMRYRSGHIEGRGGEMGQVTLRNGRKRPGQTGEWEKQAQITLLKGKRQARSHWVEVKMLATPN